MLGDLAKLVSGFFSGDSVDSESTFDVIDESEGFVGLLECDDIHETGWEGGITSDFAVDLDQIVISGLKHPQTNQCPFLSRWKLSPPFPRVYEVSFGTEIPFAEGYVARLMPCSMIFL